MPERVFHAGMWRTPEGIERRRARQREFARVTNARRIRLGRTYLGTENQFPVPREAVVAFARNLRRIHRGESQ